MPNISAIAKIFAVFSILFFVTQIKAEELTGTIDHLMYFPVHVLHDGEVLHVHADAGDTVASGALLVEMDSTSQTALVAARKSDVDQLRIELKSIEAQYERDTELFDRGSMSLLAYEAAQDALNMHRLKLSAAQSLLQIAQHQLSQTQIKAPFDAVVTMRKIHAGMNVKADARKRPLMRLASAGQFVLKSEVDLATWLQLRQSGLPSRINVNGILYGVEGERSSFYYRKHKDGMRYWAEFAFQDQTGAVVPGMTGQVSH